MDLAALTAAGWYLNSHITDDHCIDIQSDSKKREGSCHDCVD